MGVRTQDSENEIQKIPEVFTMRWASKTPKTHGKIGLKQESSWSNNNQSYQVSSGCLFVYIARLFVYIARLLCICSRTCLVTCMVDLSCAYLCVFVCLYVCTACCGGVWCGVSIFFVSCRCLFPIHAGMHCCSADMLQR